MDKHDHRKCPNCEACITNLRIEAKKIKADRDKWKTQAEENLKLCPVWELENGECMIQMEAEIERDRWKKRSRALEYAFRIRVARLCECCKQVNNCYDQQNYIDCVKGGHSQWEFDEARFRE